MQVVVFLVSFLNSYRYFAFSLCFMRCRTKLTTFINFSILSQRFAYVSRHQIFFGVKSQNDTMFVLVSQTYLLNTDMYTSALNNER